MKDSNFFCAVKYNISFSILYISCKATTQRAMKFNKAYSDLIRQLPPSIAHESWMRLISRKRNPMTEDEASTINPIVESFLRHEVNRYQKKLKHKRQSWRLLENLQTMYNSEASVKTHINMTNQETQTQDTTVQILPSCNHEKEINDQVMKKLEITHRQLLELHIDVFNNFFIQDITRDYESGLMKIKNCDEKSNNKRYNYKRQKNVSHI